VSIERLTVIGLGMIGGSIALAARERFPGMCVRGVDIGSESVAYARTAGLVDEALNPKDAFGAGWFADGSDELVVIATPAAAAVEWLARLADAGFAGVVTDVVSTKGEVVAAAKVLSGTGAQLGT